MVKTASGGYTLRSWSSLRRAVYHTNNLIVILRASVSLTQGTTDKPFFLGRPLPHPSPAGPFTFTIGLLRLNFNDSHDDELYPPASSSKSVQRAGFVGDLRGLETRRLTSPRGHREGRPCYRYCSRTRMLNFFADFWSPEPIPSPSVTRVNVRNRFGINHN